MIYETHAHYDDEKFDPDRVELLSHLLKENNIDKVINVGASIQSSKNSIALSKEYEYIYAAIGVHPEEISELTKTDMEWMIENAKSNPKIVAIGEIGLDYYWVKDQAERENQRYWFKKQLEVAHIVDLPVIIHSRDACDDTLNTIKDYNKTDMPGVIHCYSYSKEIAQEYIKLGWYIGVGGVVTFKNAKKLVETVEEIPLERVVLETDSPYMAPVPNRGTRNDSRNLKYVAAKIAEIKGITQEEVEAVTYENAMKLFSRTKRN